MRDQVLQSGRRFGCGQVLEDCTLGGLQAVADRQLKNCAYSLSQHVPLPPVRLVDRIPAGCLGSVFAVLVPFLVVWGAVEVEGLDSCCGEVGRIELVARRFRLFLPVGPRGVADRDVPGQLPSLSDPPAAATDDDGGDRDGGQEDLDAQERGGDR
ncbi:hypothetical protein PUR49_07835 [Streptomyces sp. BE147]|uniref:hypothetical protein n=1 Tax=Streptomyces sp. BE147 TaxID=3002524 RepID=UPI002E797384|nr:hypothetical protein [Streptomyces sp. BE147]MEE1736410.1 hypothetical protein [Streptomyces sp. BE147]